MSQFLQHFRLLIVGFCMGIADLIPGVSGGTIAFISGIYDRLINGLKTFDVATLRLVLRGRLGEAWHRVPVFFFIPLGLGMATAILSLSHLLGALFDSHPEQLWSLFFGLIVGSIALLYRETRPWQRRGTVTFTLAAIATFLVVGIPATQTPAASLSVR